MPASLPAGVKDKQNMAHLKCRLPQVVVLAVLNEQNLGGEMLFFFFFLKILKLHLWPKTQHIKNSHLLFLEFCSLLLSLCCSHASFNIPEDGVHVMVMTCFWYPWGLEGVSHFSPEDLPWHNPEANRYLGMNELGCTRANKYFFCCTFLQWCSGVCSFLFPCVVLTFLFSATLLLDALNVSMPSSYFSVRYQFSLLNQMCFI